MRKFRINTLPECVREGKFEILYVRSLRIGGDSTGMASEEVVDTYKVQPFQPLLWMQSQRYICTEWGHEREETGEKWVLNNPKTSWILLHWEVRDECNVETHSCSISTSLDPGEEIPISPGGFRWLMNQLNLELTNL